jgi:hypothetical protein
VIVLLNLPAIEMNIIKIIHLDDQIQITDPAANDRLLTPYSRR